ncbi:phosphate acetyltransferase [Pseudomonas lalucatii]|uniref:Phosphate acetyltransferase n=1 Tax=Pseudomonas lalucatii TaxID=1424203 RepID=A0ABS5PZ30_9PSED|nr:phosphate acetyltransferase [Pseudomonas lalucatii]MBS7661751.1 phosphate acetyltransferase [Pseudomonas lalucatii]MBS7691227.1 phosphate acetyltransferase [Pseudomonas lalucatii]MBS7726300.1 phosphate acetyltransferase [Pseudomonas lalucatii]QVM88124.1 phosphate acetyltransferase [Pseudomonas lalucatii]
MHCFFIAPTGFGVGLTSTSLGLVGALERAGLRVGFFKPVAQPHPDDTGPERSSALIARTHGLHSPAPLALSRVEQMLGDGRLDELLEDLLERYRQAAADKDVVIVEAMVPTRHTSYAARVNFHLAKSLDAEVILVAAPEQEGLGELCDRLEIQAQQFGGTQDPKVLGVILNKVRSEDGIAAYARRLQECSALFRGEHFRLLGCVPWQDELNAPRSRDIAELLGARLLNAGDYEQRRVLQIVLCARAVANTVQLLKPGTLVVTPGDRDDIILAASLAAMNGVPLAGLLLCSDFNPDPRIMQLCRGALASGLPVMTVSSGSYDTATHLNRLNKEIPLDDRERAEKVAEFVAGHVDHDWLRGRCGGTQALHLSPAAFRYQLLQRAMAANRRIVLPEGSEPRTVQAAALCQARGIARCVLLGKPEEVRAVAQAQGIELPPGLEILDPDLVRARYVAPMVELRQGKGLNAPMATAQLEDNVVLGTMMLALGEVDGLVAGAIHTTANTIRPALQLIKTAADYSLVSSVYFLLLPDQVLVYGDCAVNPQPNAEQLAQIALQSADSARALGIVPRLAMLSCTSADSAKVAEATRLARLRRPDLALDGPLPYDAAGGRLQTPDRPPAERATVLVFPDLDSGNSAYRALQRDTHCVGVGPMLQGLRKPVNDLPRGAQVDDILYTVALTAIQAADLP